MATEEQLIRQLRILYGIAPDSPQTLNNTGVSSTVLSQLQSELAGIPRVITSGRHTMVNPRWVDANNRYQAALRGANQSLASQPDPGSAEAAKNRGLLDSMFSGIKQSTVDDGTRELNQRFVGTLRQDRSRLAARGLTGGSAARSTQARTLSDLLLGRQRLASAADSADQTARQSLDEQRQETERSIKLGTQPDVSTINTLQQAQAGLNQAYRGITESALGGLLTRGADSYRDMNQADAYGRRGFGTLSPSAGRTGSASGSIY